MLFSSYCQGLTHSPLKQEEDDCEEQTSDGNATANVGDNLQSQQFTWRGTLQLTRKLKYK